MLSLFIFRGKVIIFPLQIVIITFCNELVFNEVLKMDNYLDKKLLEKVISRFLSKEERLLYGKVINMENVISERALTPEHFVDLLRAETPHKQVAVEFNLSLPELLEVLKEIEEKIENRIEKVNTETRWIDCTNAVSDAFETNENRKYFYTEGL